MSGTNSTNDGKNGPLSAPMSIVDRTNSVDAESIQVFLRSLNESVPADMLGEVPSNRSITQQELRSCIKDMFITLGYDWSDKYAVAVRQVGCDARLQIIFTTTL